MITHSLRHSLCRIVFTTQCKTVWTILIHKQCHEKVLKHSFSSEKGVTLALHNTACKCTYTSGRLHFFKFH